MATKKTFYIVSDNIQDKSKDKARIKKIAKAFRELGHKSVVCEVSSNAHTHPKKYGCTKKNDVWVCVFGGVCGGTVADLTGYVDGGFGNWFKNDQLKKASLFFIWVSKPEGASINVATAKKLPRAWDDNFSPSKFKGIPNPVSYLKKKGVTWIESGTTDGIVQLIKNQNWQGSGFDIDGDTTQKEIKNSYTITKGFDKQNPFEAYLKVDYAIGSRKGKQKTIYIDWQSKAPSTTNKFTNDFGIEWHNREKRVHQINLLDKIKSIEDPQHTKDTKYYLKKVTFMRDFQDELDDKETEEKENLAYDNNDQSSYKMLLYDLGVFNGEIAKMESLGLGGKTLLDGVKTVLDKANYNFNIKYAEHRDDDYLNFSEEVDTKNIKYLFDESFNGNILDITNVKYSPTSQLMNSSVVVYKPTKKENDPTVNYTYARKCNRKEIWRFGEQMKVENWNIDTGLREASQRSYDNLMQYFQPVTTFTVKSVGLPPVEIGDWVETKTVNPLLTNEYKVESRKINIDVTDRPMIQTEYGLGDIDTTIKVKKNLAKQRKALVRKPLDLDEPVQYEDSQTDEFMNNVWVD